MPRYNTTYSNRPSRAAKAAHRQAKVQYPTYDTSPIRPPKKSKKKPLIIILVILLVLVALFAVSFFACAGCSKTLPQGQTIEVKINEGATATEIADQMSKSGVVENQISFLLTVFQMGANSQLKPGVYVFEGGKSVHDYVQQLCDGPFASSPKIIVAEGAKIKDIAKNVEKATNGRIKAEEFVNKTSNASKYATKYSFLKEVGKNSLEGYLYPMTYSVSSDESCEDIINKMLDQFQESTKDLDWSYPQSKGLSKYETIILASIIEKESAQDLHSTVASVFYNRLNKHMYLNSDATTAYEVGHDPTSEEVHKHTPYSTYTNYGLPPTPICSPGMKSLEAVCHPKETNYLYFYFAKDKDGQLNYKFSETYEQHQDAINSM